MARLSPRNLLYLKISNNLPKSDIKALRASLVTDGHLGLAQVEKATPQEMFDMLEADAKLQVGDLGLLLSFLRACKRFDLVKEVEKLEREESGESVDGEGAKRRISAKGSNKRAKVGYSTDGASRDSQQHPTQRPRSRSAGQAPDAQAGTSGAHSHATQQRTRRSKGHAGRGQGGGSSTASASTSSSKKNKVFISYSMDPYPVADLTERDRRAARNTQRRRVKELADKLRENGVDAWIDQYDEHRPPHSWPKWMEDQIERADYVLMICSPHYKECIVGKNNKIAVRGHGVRFEGLVIYGQLSDSKNHEKFLPVFFDEINPKHVPGFLMGSHKYGPIEDPPEYRKNSNYNTLLFKLLDKQPADTRPQPVGCPPFRQ